MQLVQQYNLPTLAIALERPGTAGMAHGHVRLRLQEGTNQLAEVLIETAALNMPANQRELRAYQDHDPLYTFPAAALVPISEALPALLTPGAPLWLLFDAASGFLPLVPWEHLLQPLLDVPLLRVPSFLLNPVSDPNTLDMVICASSPRSESPVPIEDVILRIAVQALANVERETRIHVFTDAGFYPRLRSWFDDHGVGTEVQLYDPAQSGITLEPALGEEGSATLYNGGPWLEWIVAALDGRSVDVVHFVGHGYLATDRGTLMLAESPFRNEHREILVSAKPINAFLTAIGAWSVGFSAPPQNYSGSGLRLLAEQLAQLRPGPVLMHDFADDPACAALGAAYSFLYSGSGLPPASGAISLYCHPDYVQPDVSEHYGIGSSDEQLRRYTIAKGPARSLFESKEQLPNWVARSQRLLEQLAAELGRTQAVEVVHSATREGVEQALSYVSGLLSSYATQQEKEPKAASPTPEAREDEAL